MKTMTTLIALGLLSVQGTGVAQQTETPEEQESRHGIPATPHQEQATREVKGDLFKQLDKDGDGEISQQEAQAEAQLSDNWDQFDRNDDGKLDSRELDRFDQ
ncbi:MAG: hypothetical protein ACREQ8_18860 [Woeseiaceae bacterium]